MPRVHSNPEQCAIAALSKNIPQEFIFIQDTLALFLKRNYLRFSNRPDKLSVDMEVWCENGHGGMVGIIRYIDLINILDIKIGVEPYSEHPVNRVMKPPGGYPSSIVLKPEKVFQIFQSTVQWYNVKKHYGFLTHKDMTSFFFHSSGVFFCSFPKLRIGVGHVVKHTIRYNFHERSQKMDIIATHVYKI